MDNNTVPKITKAARAGLGLSQRKFAVLAGVSNQAVAWWERGIMRPMPERLAAFPPDHPLYEWAQAILRKEEK